MASFWTKYQRNKREVESLYYNHSNTDENDVNSTCNDVCNNNSNLDEMCFYDDDALDDFNDASELSSTDEEITDSDTFTEDEAPPATPDLQAELKLWSTNHKCSQQSVNELLRVLRKYHPDLPKDVRTLFRNTS